MAGAKKCPACGQSIPAGRPQRAAASARRGGRSRSVVAKTGHAGKTTSAAGGRRGRSVAGRGGAGTSSASGGRRGRGSTRVGGRTTSVARRNAPGGGDERASDTDNNENKYVEAGREFIPRYCCYIRDKK